MILINSWGSWGDLFPYIGIGKALVARGHRVRLAVPALYRAEVEAAGLEHAPVGPDLDPNDRAFIARAVHPSKGPEAIVNEMVAPYVARAYAELTDAARGADAIVTHPVAFGGAIVAEKTGLPWISTVLAPMSFFSVTDMPVIAAAPWMTRAQWLGAWVARAQLALARRVTRRWCEPVETLRRELGLEGRGNPLFEGQFSPLLTLALFSRVLAEPQPDWPRHTEITGFSFYNGPDPLDAQVEAFLAAGPPPIVFTLGSSAVGAAGRFYEESAAAASRIGARAIVMAGPYADNRPSTASPDLLVIERASHQLLFPRAAVVVHHGGVGTTGQALRAGVPTLVVPHSHDQPDNATRLRRLALSRTLAPHRYRRGRVGRELLTLLEQPSYGQRARQVRELVRAEPGADGAAQRIEAVVSLKGRLEGGNA